MRVFLMGMPGSGKSTVGKKLAAKLRLGFADLDLYIEKKFNKKISDIFSSEGELAFRKKERDSLLEVIDANSNAVISLGGGTPCFFDNLEAIKKNGISVYIEMPSAALKVRLQQGRGERPLFAGLNESELLFKLNKLLHERERFYSAAHIIVNGTDLDTDKVAALIKTQAGFTEK